jgi:hypothetical protein
LYVISSIVFILSLSHLFISCFSISKGFINGTLIFLWCYYVCLIFLVQWDRLELRALCSQSRLSITWATSSVHLFWLFWREGLTDILPGPALNLHPPNVNFPSS